MKDYTIFDQNIESNNMIGQTFTLLFSVFLITATAWAQVSEDSLAAYNESIEKYRTGKNIKLMYTEGTPLKPDQQKNFKGLKYFPPDFQYLVKGKLSKLDVQEVVVLKTSTERAPEYIKFGLITFEMKGESYQLTAYQSKKLVEVSKNETSLFIPFRDETTGKETYIGGRYVDCEIPQMGDSLLIDFNKAYNPYCAYNPRFSCVIPPEENRLPISIEAGEKTFKEH